MADGTAAAGERRRPRLINPAFTRLWAGQAVSSVGDFVFDTTLVLWVATGLGRDRSWAPVAVAGVMISVGAAVLLVGPIAGVFVDRWDRRGLMMRTETIRAVLVAALAALAFLPTSALPVGAWLVLIYAIVFGVNVCGQFFSPARFAVVSEVVEGDADRARAAGIGQATTATASIIGPPIAAPLLFATGVQAALILNAASYVFSYFAIRSVPLARHIPAGDGAARSTVRRDLASGLRFFFGSRFLVVLLTVAVIAQCGTGAINALDVFFVTGNLHASAHLFGFMATAFGIGAIAGSLVAGRVVNRFGARRVTWWGLVATGLLVVGYSRQSHFWSGIVLLTAFSLPVAMLNTSITPLLLKVTPSEYLGRMAAVFNPINQLASMASVVAAGWLASTALKGLHARFAGLTFGGIDAIFGAAGLLILLAGLFASVSLPREDHGGERDAQPRAAVSVMESGGEGASA